MLTNDEISDIAMQSGAYDEQLSAFARAIEAAVLAKLQAQSEPVPKGVLLALSNAGLMLIKTQHGYEVRKLGQITAQAAPVQQVGINGLTEAETDASASVAGLAVQQDVNRQLLEKAKAVVQRWETPLWKDVPATAVFINELREAIAAVEGKHD